MGGGGGGILGSIVGGLVGSGGDEGQFTEASMANYGRGAANRNQGAVNDIMPQQKEFGQQLAQQAMGQGQSITGLQLKAAQDRNLQQQFGALQANRSVNPALAQRQFMQSAAQQGQQTAQAAGIQGLQEQQMNQQAFQNYINSAHQQEMNAIGGTAQAGQALNQAENANANRNTQVLGSLISAGGQAATMGAGGKYDGGMIQSPKPVPAYGPRSIIGQHFHNMQSGGNVPGQASVNGDSPQNDTVPAMLSPGEIVIPRSVMNQKNPAQAAAKFVAAVLAKKGR